jgi:hypothetical protein
MSKNKKEKPKDKVTDPTAMINFIKGDRLQDKGDPTAMSNYINKKI